MNTLKWNLSDGWLLLITEWILTVVPYRAIFFWEQVSSTKTFCMSSSNVAAAVSELLVKKKNKKNNLQEALYSPPAHHHRCSGVCLWARLVLRGKGCKYVRVCQLQTAFVTIKDVELRGFPDCREAVRCDFVVFAKAKLSQAFFFFFFFFKCRDVEMFGMIPVVGNWWHAAGPCLPISSGLYSKRNEVNKRSHFS